MEIDKSKQVAFIVRKAQRDEKDLVKDKMDTMNEKTKNKLIAVEGASVDYKASVVFLTSVKQKKKRWERMRCAMCIQIGLVPTQDAQAELAAALEEGIAAAAKPASLEIQAGGVPHADAWLNSTRLCGPTACETCTLWMNCIEKNIPSSLVLRTNMGLKYVLSPDTWKFLRSIALLMPRPFEVLHSEDEALTLSQVEGVGGRAVTP